MKENKCTNLEKIEFQLTTSCNMKCKFCFHGDEVSYQRLDTDVVCKSIKELTFQTKSGYPYANLKSVWLTGGEPLLEIEAVSEIIRISKSMNLITVISTNGLLLEKNLDQLLKSGLDEVKISLDSLDTNLFQNLRGGSLSTVLNNIKLVAKTPIKTHIRITVNNDNVNSIGNIVEEMADVGLATIELKAVLPIGRSDFRFMPNHNILEKAINDAIKKIPPNKTSPYVTAICNYLAPCKGFSVSPNIPCTCSHSSLYIAATGDILPCGYFPKESQYNIYRDSLLDAWTGSFFNTIRNSVPDECTTCKDWDLCKNGCPAVLYNHGHLNNSCFDLINEKIAEN